MTTRWFSIADAADTAAVEAAAAILRGGGLLAFPTETVYGLGANAFDAAAAARIFEAKGRPQDNPLIVHLAGAEDLPRCCRAVPEAARRLAEAFWPGPLTMILPRSAAVPDVVTAGLDSVGVRCPDHEVTRAILRRAGVPAAAPSANRSGRPSCTTAAHVREDMDGRIDGIVDGGPCRAGVESTIVDLTVTPPRLLRPGALPVEAIERLIGPLGWDPAVTGETDAPPRAPGMKYRHYAPKAPVTVVSGPPAASGRFLRAHVPEGAGVLVFDEFAPLFPAEIVRTLGPADDREEQARRLFGALRSFDGTPAAQIFAQCPESAGIGLAAGNRLKKAAGFRVVEARAAARVIGITGGTGAGKTSLLRALGERGAELLDCDAIYYETLRTDAALRAALTETFGAGIFRADGELDRQALGAAVFGDAARLAALDGVVRRFLPRAIARRIEASRAPLVGLDAIKLLESGLGALCDLRVAVTAPAEARLRRVMARDGVSEDYARARIAAQRDEAYFRARCDAVWVNDADGPEAALRSARAFLDVSLQTPYGRLKGGSRTSFRARPSGAHSTP